MDLIRVQGHVTISTPTQAAAVHPKLYRRDGRFYLPDGAEVFDGVLQRGSVLHESENLVTALGRKRYLALCSGLSADFPDRMAVGDGGLESGTSAPLIPQRSQTVLAHEISRVNVTQRILNEAALPSFTFLTLFKATGSYQFAQPGQSQISEVGLFCRDGVMTNVHNFAPIPVDVHRLGVLVEWEVVLL